MKKRNHSNSSGNAPFKPRHIPHVALVLESATAFGRRMIAGIGQYVHENGPWTMYVEHRAMNSPAPVWLKRWHSDGVICKATDKKVAMAVKHLGIPAIDLNEQVLDHEFPAVMNDNAAIGRLAARHLLERGFSSFAFVGHPGTAWADNRKIGFCREVEGAGSACKVYRPHDKTRARYQLISWDSELRHMRAWLEGLTKPVGVMAANDFRAVQVLDACRDAGLAVPEEVAIIGVDDDDVVQAVAQPSLSSIIPNAGLMGYRAAALLDALMAGRRNVAPVTLVPPVGVATRQSTDLFAIGDPVLAQALRFIREHACEGIQVGDVANHVKMARAVLQRRFRRDLNRSILEEITNVRIARIKALLSQTDLSLWEIADRVCIAHVEYLSVYFKRATGMTLSDFRAQHAGTSVIHAEGHPADPANR